MIDRHSCNECDAAVADERVAFIYRSIIRDYGIRMVSHQITPRENDIRDGNVHIIRRFTTFFCPWCGDMFPGDLNDEILRIIKEEILGPERFEEEFSIFRHCEDLPDDMLTDAWWKKRGYGGTNPVLSDDWENPVLDEVIISNESTGGGRFPGYRRPPGRSPHKCDYMASNLYDERIMSAYLPHVREYGVRILDLDLPVDFQRIRIKVFEFCPYCGEALPESLRPEWEKQLADAGLEPNDPCVPTNLPKELATDAWWRHAGL